MAHRRALPQFQTLLNCGRRCVNFVPPPSPISVFFCSAAGVDLEAGVDRGGGGGRGRLLPLQRLRRPRAAHHVEEDGR